MTILDKKKHDTFKIKIHNLKFEFIFLCKLLYIFNKYLQSYLIKREFLTFFS